MFQKILQVFIFSLTVFLVGIHFASGQEKEFDLKNKKITIKMEKMPFGLVLEHLWESCDTPIGYEQSTYEGTSLESVFSVNSPTPLRYHTEIIDGVWKLSENQYGPGRVPLSYPITVFFENEPLEKVLNSVVEQMVNYDWEIKDGVVNIFPINGREPKLEELLNLKIKEFKFEKDQTIGELCPKIEKLPEVSEFLKNNNLEFLRGPNPTNGVIEKKGYERKIEEEMEFSNLTLRELLNKITKIKRGAWITKLYQGYERETVFLNI